MTGQLDCLLSCTSSQAYRLSCVLAVTPYGGPQLLLVWVATRTSGGNRVGELNFTFRSQSRVHQIDFTFPTRFGCPPTQLAFHQIELVEIDVEVEVEVVFNFQSHQIVFPSLHNRIPTSTKIDYFSNRWFWSVCAGPPLTYGQKNQYLWNVIMVSITFPPSHRFHQSEFCLLWRVCKKQCGPKTKSFPHLSSPQAKDPKYTFRRQIIICEVDGLHQFNSN